MALTAEQIAANRQTAIATTRAALGLSNTPSDWTYEQRLAYNQALASFIASNPDQFGAQDLTNAEYVQKNPGTPLEDASFQFGDFVTETLKPAGDALQSVGSGVFTVANAAKWAIPAAVALLALIFLVGFGRKQGAIQ